jgi:hypothetical protein
VADPANADLPDVLHTVLHPGGFTGGMVSLSARDNLPKYMNLDCILKIYMKTLCARMPMQHQIGLPNGRSSCFFIVQNFNYAVYTFNKFILQTLHQTRSKSDL